MNKVILVLQFNLCNAPVQVNHCFNTLHRKTNSLDFHLSLGRVLTQPLLVQSPDYELNHSFNSIKMNMEHKYTGAISQFKECNVQTNLKFRYKNQRDAPRAGEEPTGSAEIVIVVTVHRTSQVTVARSDLRGFNYNLLVCAVTEPFMTFLRRQ